MIQDEFTGLIYEPTNIKTNLKLNTYETQKITVLQIVTQSCKNNGEKTKN